MKRVFIGLFGMVFGAILLVPSFLMDRVFGGSAAVGPNMAILGLQATGIILLLGFPLVFWLVLPFFDRRERKKSQV